VIFPWGRKNTAGRMQGISLHLTIKGTF
jgi:hypothetical protein